MRAQADVGGVPSVDVVAEEGRLPPPPSAEALCPAPFTVMDFAPEGNVHACCVNASHPLGNVRWQSLREIWTGGRARVLREAMERRDFAYGCGSCRHRLALGTGEPDLAYYQRQDAAEEEGWPDLMAFGLRNTCNLACVMCGGNLSSRLRALEGRSRLEPAYGDRFFEELVEFLPHLRRAEFRGGEPFLVREHFRVWDLLVELGLEPEVQVTTNGTVWNEAVEAALEAHAMQVTFSIDGATAETNSAIRVGTDHAAVLQNLQRFAEHARRRGTRLDLSFCVMRENWRELGALLQVADGLGIEGHPQLVLDPAHGLQRLPADELRDVVTSLEAQTDALALTLDVNRTAWHKMLGWLTAELRQRDGGTPLRLWEPPGAGSVTHVALTRRRAGGVADAPDGVLAVHRKALGDWATNGAVGEIVTDGADRVIDAELGPLLPGGWSEAPDLRGCTFEEAVERLAGELGPNVWVVDEFVDADRVDQTLLLAPTTHRDKSGVLLRLLSVAPGGPGGAIHTLLAADTYYWDRVPA